MQEVAIRLPFFIFWVQLVDGTFEAPLTASRCPRASSCGVDSHVHRSRMRDRPTGERARAIHGHDIIGADACVP
jgi:hypothetical protein